MASNITISNGATVDIANTASHFADGADPNTASVLNVSELQTALGGGSAFVTTSTLDESDPGNIQIAASIVGGGSSALSLHADGDIMQTLGAAVTVGTLAVSAAGSVALTAANNIATLQTSSAANFALTTVSALTIGGTLTTAGDTAITSFGSLHTSGSLNNSAGTTTVSASGGLTVASSISAHNAATLTAAGAVTVEGNITAEGISISATGGGGSAGDVTIGSTSADTLNGGHHDIVISAGDDLTITSSTALTTTAAVRLYVDSSADNGIGGTATLNGNIIAASASLTGAGDADALTNNTATAMTIDGAGGNDTITSSNGADTLIGGAGNDTLDGGGGADVAQFSGNRADYTITYVSGNTLRVADIRSGAPDGTDVVSNVETFHFADGEKTYSALVRDPTVNPQPAVASIVRAAGAAATVPTADTSVSYTVTFTEAVTGVDASDFELTTTGSALGHIASISGSGTTYAVTVDTAAGDGTLRLDLKGGGTGIIDEATAPVGSGYTAGATFTLDHMAPTVTANTVAFSADTGTSASDFVTKTSAQAISGILSANLGGNEKVQVSLDNGATWTVATATVGSNAWTLSGRTLTGSNTLKVRVVDDAGNIGPAHSQAYVLDTSAPSAPTATLATDSGSSASDGLTNVGTVNVGGVEASASFQYSTDSGTHWTTGSGSSFTLAAGTYTAGQVLVRQTDLAGNVGSNSSLGAVVIDTVRPTATIVLNDTALTAGETATVSIIFSEPVTGFANDDLTVEHGSLSSVASTDGGLTWTATFTPGANTVDATNAISLALTGVTDVAGNAGTGTATSPNYAIETSIAPPPTPPTPQPPLTHGTAGDDIIDAGTLTTPIYGGAGADSITSTPLAGTTAHLFGGTGFADPTDAGDTISVSGGGAADVYGNGGSDVIVFNASGVGHIFGGFGDDRITITNGANNAVVGGPGADSIMVNGNGSNLIVGGTAVSDPNDGSDTIRINGNGSNIVYANGGDDTVVITGSGSNTVYGGFGNDTIVGGSGNDVIAGGPRANVYTGGGGADHFVHAAGGQDIVEDFSFAQGDRLDLGGQAYTLTTASDGSAALVFGDGGIIILHGVTEATFQSGFVV